MGAGELPRTGAASETLPRRARTLSCNLAALSNMAARQSPCKDKQLVGRLVWHEVSFQGPGAQPCDLPENLQGRLDHVFVNGSIYPQTFTTTASTLPTALQIVGAASPPAVRVNPPRKGAFRTAPSTGSARQTLEHVARTGIGLPHTASADFVTTVTGPSGPHSPPAVQPAINVTLTP
jgi:hypothetical protein